MSLIREVKKRIGPYMKTKGFRIQNRTYYYIQNDVAYCITFEQPSGMMYTWVHVNPLYIPEDSLSLTYGTRLREVSNIALPLLRKDCDSIAIDEWCDLFFCSMNNHILPFFHQIDTPQNIVTYTERMKRKQVPVFIDCPPVCRERLKMYTYLFLQDFSQAECSLESYRNEVMNCSFFTTALQKKKLAEADEIQDIIFSGKEAVAVFCAQTINRSKMLLAKK